MYFMEKPIQILLDIENKYNVESIQVNGLNVWQFLRIRYYFQLKLRYESNMATKRRKYILNKQIKKLLLLIYSGIYKNNIRSRSFQYILFTDILEDREIDGYISDKIAYNIINSLHGRLVVCKNYRNQFPCRANRYYYKNYFQAGYFEYKIALKKRLKHYKEESIINISILDKINKEYSIFIDYRKHIKNFFLYTEELINYYIKTGIKCIFINCYYTVLHMSAIFAAKQLKIPIVE